jgi:hypothetical protein
MVGFGGRRAGTRRGRSLQAQFVSLAALGRCYLTSSALARRSPISYLRQNAALQVEVSL